MDVYLYGSDAPPLMYSFDITQKVFHRRVGLDVHHTFTDWATPLTDTQLAFLVRKLHVLLLHRPASLLLHHDTDVFIVLLKADTLHVRCDIHFIQMSQVFADVEHGRIEGCDVVCVPPIVPLTLGDVARLDVLGCFCCCYHISAFAVFCIIGYQGIGAEP